MSKVSLYIIFSLHKNFVVLSFSYKESGLQIWALAVGKKTEMFATGGSDALVNLWHDSTAAEREEAFRKEVSCFIHCFSALLLAKPYRTDDGLVFSKPVSLILYFVRYGDHTWTQR